MLGAADVVPARGGHEVPEPEPEGRDPGNGRRKMAARSGTGILRRRTPPGMGGHHRLRHHIGQVARVDPGKAREKHLAELGQRARRRRQHRLHPLDHRAHRRRRLGRQQRRRIVTRWEGRWSRFRLQGCLGSRRGLRGLSDDFLPDLRRRPLSRRAPAQRIDFPR
uniref:Uncharacterized protein n=1 Tax=Cereibacter sphaeroides (strain ATCC 17025 / ATH 2.4.3) TaxID=349102 RepID=A4WS02_CERS5